MSRTYAPAKINLALVVGPRRPDGKHEVVTLLQALDLRDELELEPAEELRVQGFAGDTLVRDALRALAATAGVEPAWHVRLEKRIPVAAGLGGGSSDAASALRLANATLPAPLPPPRLHALAAQLGADVPFFLAGGTQLGRGDGTELQPLELPLGYAVLLLLPAAVRKRATADVYRAFDERAGDHGFAERAEAVVRTLPELRAAEDLARLPPNDLASSPHVRELLELGAFRADVSGAGPVVYALFARREDAARAAAAVAPYGETWLASPLGPA